MKKLGRALAISDIHGCLKTFKKLLLEVLDFNKNDMLYLLGDYINKGPDSKGVIDFIFQLLESGYNLKCLLGNHEKYLIDALVGPKEKGTFFLSHGGKETLQSFDVDNIYQIPSKYLKLINSLAYFIETDYYLLVHAGLNFSLANPLKDKFSMLNIRDMQIDLDKIGRKIIVHGHVPTPYAVIENALKSSKNHISIDGGCVYQNVNELNNLIALDLTSNRLHKQKNIE